MVAIHPQYRYLWKALIRKFKNGTWKQRVKLLLKLLLRLAGIRRPFFLAAYREDICMEEKEKDRAVFQILSAERFNCKDQVDWGSMDFTLPAAKFDRFFRWPSEGYIALAAESMDKGGLEEVVAFLAERIAEMGISVKVFCMSQGGLLAERLMCRGIEVVIFYEDSSAFKAYIKQYPPLLVNTHFVGSFWDILDRNQIPCVETIHNMYVFLSGRQKKLEHRKSKLVTAYIAVSETVKEYFLIKYPTVDENKIKVIGNAARIRCCTEKREALRQAMGIDKEAFIFLSAGSIDPRKNQVGILRAFDIFFQGKTHSSYLILVGETTNTDYAFKLRNMLGKMECRDHVFLLPYAENVGNLLEAADCFILDSYYEGWSIAATEAAYSGLPIIHSRCGSCKELTQNMKYGISIPNPCTRINEISSITLHDFMSGGINDNMEHLVRAMICVCDNCCTWRRVREKIAFCARTEFSPENMIQSYLHVYQSVLKSREGDCGQSQ